MTAAQAAASLIGGLHVLFMIVELFPWNNPRILSLVLTKWPMPLDLSVNDKHLVAMIVHNAGVYNGIVAAGLFATAVSNPDGSTIQIALLAGGVVAGLFGAFTLAKATIAQAILSAIALVTVIYCPTYKIF